MPATVPHQRGANEPGSNLPQIPVRGRPWYRFHRRWWQWALATLLLVVICAAVSIRYVIQNAAPILRSRVVDTLSARFKGKVELDYLDISLADGVAVYGRGLKIFGLTDPNPREPGIQPLIAVQEFRFQTPLRYLFRSPMPVHTIYVKGMALNIPPKQDRADLARVRQFSKKKMTILVDELQCEDTLLIINTRAPGKAPLTFDIGSLKMKDIGSGQPMAFEATLINPRPVGEIQSEGKFGPFREANPRETPVMGNYTFTRADLGTLKGIGGILSSTGKYAGVLGRLEVDGATDTPDFRLARSGHAVDLHTDFHAVVDGTDGDTYLEPVKARFLHSSFTASGKVVRVANPRGHDIELNVIMSQARIEDLLRLGVKTEPPVISGPVSLRTQMSLSPGPEDVADRIKLAGSFKIPAGQFANEKIQGRVAELSLLGQGKPKVAKEHVDVNVSSELDGTFRLGEGKFEFSPLHFSVPGATSDIEGQYSLDGEIFDFHGKLKLESKLSQMTTGWKSILLKPVDPFFAKDGAGTEIPFKVTGTRSEPRFGLDFHRRETETSQK